MNTHRHLLAVTMVALSVVACRTSPSSTGVVSSTATATVRAVPGNAPPAAAPFDVHRLADGLAAMTVSGTVAVTGTPQQLGRIPFTAVVAGRDSLQITMHPLGMTAAKLYATRDTFLFVDYLQQTVMAGNPSSPDLVRSLPFPLTVVDLFALIRGEVPGSGTAFVEVTVKPDGGVLYGAPYRDGMLFAMIDTSARTLRQFQRKRQDGVIELNVTYDDFSTYGGTAVAKAVDVTVDDRKQTMSFRLSKISVDAPLPARLGFDAPAGFTRTVIR